jgi:hypothetical protein
MAEIAVVNADVLTVECDVLVLKYAQGFHGTDQKVSKALGLSERNDVALAVGKHLRIPTKGKLPCKRVLFVGVPQLWEFGYAEIRQFARSAMEILANEDCEKASIAMTMHGVGYGLDEREAFSAQVAGVMEYLQSSVAAWKPNIIAIVEYDRSRAERMIRLLMSLQTKAGSDDFDGRPQSAGKYIPDAGIASNNKKHVFVAMPYDEEMQDVFEFGICEPVNAAGCLCERCDQLAFTGDVLDRIRNRIASAAVVVADMTGSNPNVYLEVGYAWGKGVPTLLIAQKGQELLFDVKTHRCIYYKNISDLRRQLANLMPDVLKDGRPDMQR